MTSMMKPAEDGYRPAYETIAAKITELITSDDLKPGDRLPTEHELSEQLGVSRTVVDPTQVVSLYEFRLTLEPPAARLAAERITPHELRELREVVALNQRSAEIQQRQQFRESDAALHRMVAEATHNPFLAATIATTTRAQGWVFDIAAGRTQALLLSYANTRQYLRPSRRGSQPPPLKRCRLTWNGHCPIPSKRFGDVSALK